VSESLSDEAPPAPRSFNHFAFYRLTRDWWSLDDARRAGIRGDWVEAIGGAASAVHHYRTFPAETASDILVWCASPFEDADSPERLFDAIATAVRPFRRWLEPVDFLWGFTRASEYSTARSRQEIDPFVSRSMPYLIVYPFTKTTEWYLLDAETRQAMMNQHIRVGKSYREITQLLLYSMGLQDQEFVVVYETTDLTLFSRLVSDLRRTEARRYTKSDTPVHLGVHRPNADPAGLWP
jgi:chlorite dismutase